MGRAFHVMSMGSNSSSSRGIVWGVDVKPRTRRAHMCTVVCIRAMGVWEGHHGMCPMRHFLIKRKGTLTKTLH